MLPSNLARNVLEKLQDLQKDLSESTQQDFYNSLIYRYQNQLITKLQEIVQVDSEALIFDQLKYFLHQNWHLVKTSFLCYTSLANEPVTHLLCDLAVELSLNPRTAPSSPIELLMPGVECESINRNYSNLDVISLKNILNQYITGNDGSYLIPIKQLMDDEMGRGLNFYFSLMQDKTHLYLQQDEIDRLINHSCYSQDYANAYKEYQDSQQDHPGLLTHLKELARSFHLNSKDGLGTEEQAGNRVYRTLIEFCAYYDALELNQKNTIPALHQHIKQLIDLVSVHGSHSLEMRCIGKQREILEALIKQHQDELVFIGCNDENKKRNIEQKKQVLERAGQAFITALDSKAPIGQDKLGLSKELLDAFFTGHYTISSSRDLEILIQSHSEVIIFLAEDATLKEALLDHLSNLELLLRFMEQHSTTQCAVLFHLVGKELFRKMLINAKPWILILNQLHEDKFQLVLGIILNNQLLHESHVMLMLHLLTHDKKTVFLNAIKKYLFQILPSWNDIKSLFKTATSNELLLLLPELQINLVALMREYSDQTGKFDYFSGISAEKQHMLLELVYKNPDWIFLINQAAIFQSLLSPLIRTERSLIFEFMQDNLSALIHTTEDLLTILSVLSPQEKTLILKSVQSQLSKIIQNKKDISQLFKVLTSDQKMLLIDALETEDFKKLVTCKADYNIMKTYVSEKKRVCFEEAVGGFAHSEQAFFQPKPNQGCRQSVKKHHVCS